MVNDTHSKLKQLKIRNDYWKKMPSKEELDFI